MQTSTRLPALAKLEHTLFAFRRGQRARNGGDFHTFGQPFAELGGDVFGRGNEAAEHDGVIAFVKQPLDHGDDVLELGIKLPCKSSAWRAISNSRRR